MSLDENLNRRKALHTLVAGAGSAFLTMSSAANALDMDSFANSQVRDCISICQDDNEEEEEKE